MRPPSTTTRGVTPAPIGVVVTRVSPLATGTTVIPGRTYELRTDAQAIDGVTGAVTYPLCFVGEGGGQNDALQAAAGTMFHRLSPVRITPQSRSLKITSEVAGARVWISVVSDVCDDARDPVPAGGGCGCGAGTTTKTSCGCRGTTKASCGCGAHV